MQVYAIQLLNGAFKTRKPSAPGTKMMVALSDVMLIDEAPLTSVQLAVLCTYIAAEQPATSHASTHSVGRRIFIT